MPGIVDPRERNPLIVTLEYLAAAVAPHGATTRWNYTVPAGRRAQLESLQISLVRDGVPGAAALAIAEIAYTPSGGTSTHLLRSQEASAAVGVSLDRAVFGSMYMLAGDVLSSLSLDGSTGGTYRIDINAKLTEFDI